MAKDKEVTTPQPRQTAPARLEDQMERLFEDFFGRRWLRPWQWPRGEGIEARMPPVDVVDRENEVLVRAELPGMAKEDIEVSVSGNTITVKGSTRKEEKKEDGDFHRREIVSSSVSRTVTLPSEVEGDKARAQLKDGILEITLPKQEKAQRKRIQVESEPRAQGHPPLTPFSVNVSAAGAFTASGGAGSTSSVATTDVFGIATNDCS